VKKLIHPLIFLLLLSGCNNFDDKKMIADQVVSQIEKMIQTVEVDTLSTAAKSIEYFSNSSQYRNGLFPDTRYEFHDGIMYHNPVDEGNGKFLYSGFYPVEEKEKEKVKTLEYIIPDLKWLVHDSDYSDYIVQTYLITYDTLIIFYPYADLLSFIPPRRDIQGRGGWKNLNRTNNPYRLLMWTPPYVDTTGKGFMVDLISPVDNGDFMEAYLGIDITVSTLKKKFFDDVDEKMILIDKTTSQIMVISDEAVELLGVENAEAFRYLNMIDNSVTAKQVMPDNLVLNKTDSIHMIELWSKLGKEEVFSITIEGRQYKTYSRYIGNPQWYLVIFE
jgi:hypothetical protein